MIRPACFRCGAGHAVVTKSEVAVDANHAAVRELQVLCNNCRVSARMDNADAAARTSGATAVLHLEMLWDLRTVPEPCPDCRSALDTPVHYYDCENGGAKRWPPT